MGKPLSLLGLALPVAACWWLLSRRRWRKQSSADSQRAATGSAAVSRAAAAAAAATAEHPHAEVIEQLSKQPPQLQLPPRPEPPGPLGDGKSEYVWVARPSHLAAAAAELFEQDRIALDVEHHNVHSYGGVTCLLQLSTGAKDFLVDCLALKADMKLLDPVLSNPRVMKVVHGGGNDVLWLQRDFGLYLVNCFDTEKACQVLGFRQRSLGYLLQRYCGIKADKSLGQRADWRQRPLPPELVLYARGDVRHLLFIADCLGQELLAPPQHKAKHEEEQQLAAEAAAAEAPAIAAAAAAAAGVEPASPRAGASRAAASELAAAGSAAGSSLAEPGGGGAEQQGGQQASSSRQPKGGELVQLVEPPAGPPPSIVQPSPEAQLALEAAMAVPHSRLERTVFRSQALTLTLHQPTSPAAAVAAAAAGLMRCHVAVVLERHARLTPAQVHHLETVADCVHVLASWRDEAARQADEGLQCVMPDAELLRLAEAAASSVAPEDSNLRGRAQRISERQLLELLPSAATESPAAASDLAPPATPEAGAVGLGPEAAQGQAGAASDAAAGSGESTSGAGAAAAGNHGSAAGGSTANGTAGSCGCWPAMLQRDAAAVAAALSEAAAGQWPWVCREVQELLQGAAGGGAGALAKQGSGGGSNKLARRLDPAAFRQRQASKFAAKGMVYENCQMFSKDGELLCHTDRRKLEWYLRKGLAEKVSDSPLSVRLTFQHQTGDQQAGTSEFYTVKKSNQCVACGELGHYLRYRVVPSCYRRAMPVRLKSHRSHDIVLLCVSCHELAHAAAEKLKRQLSEEMGVPLLAPLPTNGAQQPGGAAAAEGPAAADASAGDLHPYNVRKSALAYQRYGQQMPEKKRRRIEAQIRQFLALQAGMALPPLAEPAQQQSREQAAAAGEEAAAGGGEGELTDVELYGGLLAGLGKKTRKRQLKRWVKQGKPLPPELAAEAAGAAAAAAAGGGNGGGSGAAEGADEEGGSDGEEEGAEEEGEEQLQLAPGSAANGSGAAAAAGSGSGNGVGPADLRNTGHLWHGNEVVRRLEAQGGEEALLDLCRRFRECFMSALQPQHLPPGWSTQHFGRRSFGEHSIYSKPGAN